MPNILITGTSRGLGLGFVRHFAAAGWRVFATCRNPAEASDLAGLAAESGGQLTIDTLDVDDFDAIAALAAKLSGTPIEVLRNNAGIDGRKTPGSRATRRKDSAWSTTTVGLRSCIPTSSAL